MASDAVYPRIVDRAELPPGKCAVTGDIDGPFIDTGTDMVDPANINMKYRIYIHLPYLKFNIARDLCGLVDPEEAPESDVLEAYRERAEAAELALGLVQKAKEEVPA